MILEEKRLENAVRSAWTHDDAAHDILHIKRVRANALKIAKTETNVRRNVLIAAAWLHDLVNLEKNDPRRKESSRLAAEAASSLLENWKWARQDIDAVAHAIEAHSYSAGIEPLTIEAKILRDADRLDAIGAIGIARTFSISGRLGRSLYDDFDPTAKKRPLDDSRFAIDHFYAKLLKLADGMITEGGRTLAAQRAAFMHEYINQFLVETGCA